MTVTFLGEGSPTKIDYRKSWYPYSNLSTGGPRKQKGFRVKVQGFAEMKILFALPYDNLALPDVFLHLFPGLSKWKKGNAQTCCRLSQFEAR